MFHAGCRILGSVLLPFILLNCRGDADAQDLFGQMHSSSQEDHSAGSSPGAVEVWRLDPNPEITIGVQEGPEEYALFNVYEVTALADGTMVLGLFTRNAFELRFFDRDGAFITSTGRFGPGPFEVDGAGPIFTGRLPGDSILVVSRDHRFSVFGPRGEQVRSGRLPVDDLYLRGHLIDSNHLALEKWGMGGVSPGSESYERGLVTALDLTNETLDTLAEIPGLRYLLSPDGGGFEVPFSPRAHVAAGQGRLWYGDSDLSRVFSYAVGDPGSRKVELPRPRQPVNRDDEEEYKDFDLTRATGNQHRKLRAHHSRVEFPDSFPAFDGLEVDRRGNLWVQTYEPRWSTADYVWDVLDPTGNRFATLTVPFQIIDECVRSSPGGGCLRSLVVDEGYLLVENRDSLGVQRVRRYRVLRGGEGPQGRRPTFSPEAVAAEAQKELPAESGKAGILWGIIEDSRTQEPMAGVSVTIEGQRSQAVSNLDGRFFFPAVPAGAHRLSFELKGYETYSKECDVGPGETVRVDIRMKKTPT